MLVVILIDKVFYRGSFSNKVARAGNFKKNKFKKHDTCWNQGECNAKARVSRCSGNMTPSRSSGLHGHVSAGCWEI